MPAFEREKTTPPKSLLGKAIAYALGQWERVVVYLEDGRLRPDNNLAENAKANGLEPLRYLHFLFEKLPLAKSQDDFRALLPQHLDSKTISA